MEDPLQDLSGLSLFPRNLSSFPINSTDPQSTHHFMKSLELKSPMKYLEQAKSALDSNKELLNPDFSSSFTSSKQSEANAADGKAILRGQRPELHRKKAQFKMIPDSSQSSLSSKPVRDEELSKDPEEFFAYFESREMAEKEMRRIRGETVNDAINFDLPRPERPRRPELLKNRKKFTYKHLYPSSTLSQNSETEMPSQETAEGVIPSPVHNSSQREVFDSRSQVEKKLTGSIAASESNISMLFDELLGREDLDEDGISSLVLERMQIKPDFIDEIPIPVFQDSRVRTKFRTSLADIQNLERTRGGKELAKDKPAVQSFASSRPSTSPFAPISTLQKHIQRSHLSKDSFSALDWSSQGDVEQSNDLETRNELIASGSDELQSIAGRSMNHNELYDMSVKDQFSMPEVSYMTEKTTDADSGVDVGNENNQMQVSDVCREAAPSSQFDAKVGSSPRIGTDYQTVGPDEAIENVPVMPQNAEPSMDDDSALDRMKTKDHRRDRISPAGGGSSYIDEVLPTQQTQDMEDEPSEVQLNDKSTAETPAEMPPNDQNKAKVPSQRGRKRKEANPPIEVPLNDQAIAVPPGKGRKRKEFSRRNSLAAAGTCWEEGRRKSNRIKTRPLEYWKGEKLLYGRVHESLATVIGLKYASPGKDVEQRFNEKPKLKVKSYVSGEHGDLLQKVSYY